MIKCNKALGEIIERKRRYFTPDEMETLSVSHGKLVAFEEMEEQGRLVILPCKVGDTVFRVIPKCTGSYIHCPFEGGYGLDRCNNCDAFIKEESFRFFILEDIGKTVFLTRKEAESALMKGGQDDASNT